MFTFNTVLSLILIVYGVVLIATPFTNNKTISALRIDTLAFPRATVFGKWMNFVIGLFVLGYNVYALVK